MLTLRPYQEDLSNKIKEAMRHHRSNLVRLPTGGGKTAIATDVTRKAVFKGNTVYFIVHRQELLDQTAKTFQKAGLDYISFIANGWFHDPRCPIQICSIGSLQSRLSKTQIPRLSIWDECHHLGAAGWEAVKAAFCTSYHVGLSATPERLDGKGLGKHFSNMIEGPSESWLIENGFLSDYVLYVPGAPDLSGVHTSMGDFQKGELAVAMDKSKITGDIIKHWRQYAFGKKTLLFAVTVEHSKHMVEQFRAEGIRAMHLDGGSSKEDRRAVAIDFAAGAYDILSNVDLFGEGYDLSAQAETDVTVDCVIQARPTKSFAMQRQQVGRALRPKKDGSKAIILDHAGNFWRHGYPDDDYPWSLSGTDKKAKEKHEADIISKQCPKCRGTHRPAPKCPYCGYLHPVIAREVEHVEGDLKEMKKGEARMMRNRELGERKTLDDLIAFGKMKGYKNPEKWAGYVWTARQAKKQVKIAGAR